MDVSVKAKDEAWVEVKWSHVRSEWADGRARGSWLLPHCWCLKAWWCLAPKTDSTATIVPVIPCGGSNLFLSVSTLASPRPLVGIRGTLQELHGWPGRLALLQLNIVVSYEAVSLLHCYPRHGSLHSFVCLLCSYNDFYLPLFLDGVDTLNPTITHRSTISARASAIRIRVTWAVPDSNQSKNNEFRTKASIINLSWRSISISPYLLALYVSSFSPWVWKEVGGKTDAGGWKDGDSRPALASATGDLQMNQSPEEILPSVLTQEVNTLHSITTCVRAPSWVCEHLQPAAWQFEQSSRLPE